MTRLLRDDVSPTARPSSRTSSSSPSRRNHARRMCRARGAEPRERVGLARKALSRSRFFPIQEPFQTRGSSRHSVRARPRSGDGSTSSTSATTAQRPRRLRVEQEPVVVLEQVHRPGWRRAREARRGGGKGGRPALRSRSSRRTRHAPRAPSSRADAAAAGGLRAAWRAKRRRAIARRRRTRAGGSVAPAGEPKRGRRETAAARSARRTAGDEKNKEGRKNPGRARLRREQRLRVRGAARVYGGQPPRRELVRGARDLERLAQEHAPAACSGETATVSTPRAPTSASSSCSVSRARPARPGRATGAGVRRETASLRIATTASDRLMGRRGRTRRARAHAVVAQSAPPSPSSRTVTSKNRASAPGS